MLMGGRTPGREKMSLKLNWSWTTRMLHFGVCCFTLPDPRRQLPPTSEGTWWEEGTSLRPRAELAGERGRRARFGGSTSPGGGIAAALSGACLRQRGSGSPAPKQSCLQPITSSF